MISIILEQLEKHKKNKYYVHGAVLGAFSKDKTTDNNILKLFGLKIREKDIDWRAIVESNRLLSKEEVNEILKRHIYDPDKGNTPYYFLVIDKSNNREYIIFGNDSKWYSINTKEDKLFARNIGLEKGINKEYLDFLK